jgi:hypothetical protein
VGGVQPRERQQRGPSARRQVGSLAPELVDDRVALRRERLDETPEEVVGAGGGSATGIAAVSADEDPVAIAQKCSGEGLRRVRIDIDIATTPSMAG